MLKINRRGRGGVASELIRSFVIWTEWIMRAEEILTRARQENRTVLTEIEAKQLLMQAGINCMDTQLASTKDGAVVVDARTVLSAA